MPCSATGLAYDLETPSEAAERSRPCAIVRTLLAGDFAAHGNADRLAIEALFAEQSGGPHYRVLPGASDPVSVLGRNGADLVLLDLAGPIAALLTLVNQLRAAASESVVFIGILPCDASQATRLYLPAVLDAVVRGPIRAAGLVWAITDALQSTPFLAAGNDDALPRPFAIRH